MAPPLPKALVIVPWLRVAIGSVAAFTLEVARDPALGGMGVPGGCLLLRHQPPMPPAGGEAPPRGSGDPTT